METAEQAGEDQRYDGHELDEDVDAGAAGVLQGIAHCVAYHSSLVDIAALAHSLAVRIDQVASFDVFLSIVPSASRVGRRDCQLNA